MHLTALHRLCAAGLAAGILCGPGIAAAQPTMSSPSTKAAPSAMGASGSSMSASSTTKSRKRLPPASERTGDGTTNSTSLPRGGATGGTPATSAKTPGGGPN